MCDFFDRFLRLLRQSHENTPRKRLVALTSVQLSVIQTFQDAFKRVTSANLVSVLNWGCEKKGGEEEELEMILIGR